MPHRISAKGSFLTQNCASYLLYSLTTFYRPNCIFRSRRSQTRLLANLWAWPKILRARARNIMLPWPPHLQNASDAYAYGSMHALVSANTIALACSIIAVWQHACTCFFFFFSCLVGGFIKKKKTPRSNFKFR